MRSLGVAIVSILIIFVVFSSLVVFFIFPRAMSRNGKKGMKMIAERFQDPELPRFVDHDELSLALAATGHLSDRTCSASDLVARGGASSPAAARASYVAGLVTHAAPGSFADRLRRLCAAADAACVAAGRPELAAIPWKVALLEPHVEAGFPHTLDHGIVCLPTSFLASQDEARALETLIHEKVHLLQRERPDLAARDARALGYEPFSGAIPATTARRLRSNPDLDGRLYRLRSLRRPHGPHWPHWPHAVVGDGCVPAALFPDFPQSLKDARIECVEPSHTLGGTRRCLAGGAGLEFEHPYEHAAYLQAAQIMSVV